MPRLNESPLLLEFTLHLLPQREYVDVYGRTRHDDRFQLRTPDGQVYERAINVVQGTGWHLIQVGESDLSLGYWIGDDTLRAACPGPYPFPTLGEHNRLMELQQQAVIRNVYTPPFPAPPAARRFADALNDIFELPNRVADNAFGGFRQEYLNLTDISIVEAGSGFEVQRPRRLDDSHPEGAKPFVVPSMPVLPDFNVAVPEGQSPLPRIDMSQFVTSLEQYWNSHVAGNPEMTQKHWDMEVARFQERIDAARAAREFMILMMPKALVEDYFKGKEVIACSPKAKGWSYGLNQQWGMTRIYHAGRYMFDLCVHITNESEMPAEDVIALNYLNIMADEWNWVSTGNPHGNDAVDRHLALKRALLTPTITLGSTTNATAQQIRGTLVVNPDGPNRRVFEDVWIDTTTVLLQPNEVQGQRRHRWRGFWNAVGNGE